MEPDQKHRKVVQHIKHRIDIGHDVLEIKKYLENKGLANHEIEKGFDVAYKEIEDLEKKYEGAIDFVYPTKGKLILPILLIIFLTLHFFSNAMLLPELGNNFCSIHDAKIELKKVTLQEKVKFGILQRQLFEAQQNNVNIYKKKIIADFPLAFTSVLKLDPFFPLPCETQNIISSIECYHTITKEEQKCLDDGEHKTLSPSIIIHIMIVFLELYLLNCFISWCHKRFKIRLSRRAKELVEFLVILLIILLLITATYYYVYILKVITLV